LKKHHQRRDFVRAKTPHACGFAVALSCLHGKRPVYCASACRCIF
jgi:hypothetical protein